MRVLWLTPVQLPLAAGEDSMLAGGWLEGLRLALEKHAPGLELGIASWGPVRHLPFAGGNATYFSLARDRTLNRVGRAVAAWQHDAIPREAVLKAVEVARSFAPDLIHVHGVEHPLGLAALGMPQPRIATLQGWASVCRRVMLRSVPVPELVRDTATRRFLRGEGFAHAYLQMARSAAVERDIVAGFHYFLSHNDWDRTVLRVMNPTAESFLSGHVLQEPFYRATWSPPQTTRADVFCTSGSPPYKGLETLVEGLGLLVAAGCPAIHLSIAGSIKGSAVWPMLSRLVKRFGLSDRVSWLGPMRAVDLARALTTANVFVLPSHIENEPNALLEAMLVGVPCVAAAVGGVPTMLQQRVHGLLYSDGDPYALAAAVLELVEAPALARTLAARAREHASELCDPQVVALRVARAYQRVAEGA